MVTGKQKKDCCGCGACAALCPHGAITMKEDEEGFYYPDIDASKCTKCGLCDKACAFEKKPEPKEPDCYVAQHQCREVCVNSTSGGMYTALSDAILAQNGIVYAPDFAEDCLVVHKRIITREARDHSRGAKYVQSLSNGFHTELLKDLKDGKTVIFFGTPCQVAGVLAVVPQKHREKLYCVDVICNGVGSPMAWKGFVQNLEKKHRKSVDKYIFRPKTQGYLTSQEVVVWSNGTQAVITMEFERYNPFYHQGYIMRPSCIGCVYTSISRTSDITIGDFSKKHELPQEMERSRGLSTLLVNTEKGKALLELCRAQLTLYHCTPETVMQLRLQKSSEENPNRKAFLKCVREYGFLKARNWKYSFVKRIKMRVVPLLQKGKK